MTTIEVNEARSPRRPLKRSAGTGSSVVVDRCQVCGDARLESILFLGYLPPVNQMRKQGERPHEQPAYPAELLVCRRCDLVQLGLIVDPAVLFPPEYPYSSGTTKILRENFAELQREFQSLFPLGKDDLVVDVGSNDGTLLSNFKNAGNRVLGIEPTDMGKLAQSRGIDSMISFFHLEAAKKARASHGAAKLVTATNVFAHIEDVHGVVEGILHLLDEKGIFVSESHYWPSLVETVQYDTIYHEHLRYYSLRSLKFLFEMHGLEILHAKRIPTHGGSIRVYAARKGAFKPQASARAVLDSEPATEKVIPKFRRDVVLSKMKLYELLVKIKEANGRIYAIGAPSRASTLVNYVGLDSNIVDRVLEIKGSYKIGKYMPGTLIPVDEESRLFTDQPEYALLLSWHIADELMPKLREKGFRGKFIVPLPGPKIVG